MDEALPMNQAWAAWRTVGIPVLAEDEAADPYVTVLAGAGDAGTVPRSIFTPKQHQLRDPTHDHTGLTDKAIKLVNKDWLHGKHVGGILDQLHPGLGTKVSADVLIKGILHASRHHYALTAVTTGRILLGAETGLPYATMLSIWDNGVPFEDTEDMQAAFMPEVLYADEFEGPGRCLTKAVINTFGGMLSVVSGEHRLDFTRGPAEDTYHKTSTHADAIEGNMLVAWLPVCSWRQSA
jgi:hypothetical protein